MTSDFWSRRREAVAKEAQADEAALISVSAAQREADLAGKTDEELLTEAGLGTPEELDSADAVREFLSSTLPQRLKTRALRRLWRLNPVLANVDGLVDYGEDFTDSATVIENLQTAYQVGKGMRRHVEEMARKVEEALELQEPEVSVEEPDERPVEVPVVEPVIAATEIKPAAESEVPDALPLSRHRMKFTFDEQGTG